MYLDYFLRTGIQPKMAAQFVSGEIDCFISNQVNS
jgi:hypothetical protein